MEKPLLLTDKNFKEEVIDSKAALLVDFWSSWCPPCKMMESVVDELASEFEGKIRIAKVNVDQNPGIANQLNIQGVPTFITFKNGKQVARSVGAQSKKQLHAFLKNIESPQ